MCHYYYVKGTEFTGLREKTEEITLGIPEGDKTDNWK